MNPMMSLAGRCLDTYVRQVPKAKDEGISKPQLREVVELARKCLGEDGAYQIPEGEIPKTWGFCSLMEAAVEENFLRDEADLREKLQVIKSICFRRRRIRGRMTIHEPPASRSMRVATNLFSEHLLGKKGQSRRELKQSLRESNPAEVFRGFQGLLEGIQMDILQRVAEEIARESEEVVRVVFDRLASDSTFFSQHLFLIRKSLATCFLEVAAQIQVVRAARNLGAGEGELE